MPKLIVVMAFDRDEEGELQPAFDPMEQQSEEQAIHGTGICSLSQFRHVITCQRNGIGSPGKLYRENHHGTKEAADR